MIYEQASKVIFASDFIPRNSLVHGIPDKAYLRFNPASVCALPRIEKKNIKPLNKEQSGAFLKAIKGSRFETLFTLDLFTGMREGEILGLMWECVDFTKGTIYIKQQLQRERTKNGKYYFAPLKNDKSRTITPAPWIMNLLKEHKNKQKSHRLAAGDTWQDSGLVFTDEIGGHFAIPTVYKHFKNAAAAIGCPSARFHDLRHSYTVAAIRSGDDIKTIQDNLGHATASFTLDIYGHVTDEMKKDSADRMEAYIKSVINR